MTLEEMKKVFKVPKGQKRRSDIVAVYYYTDWRDPQRVVTDYFTY